SDLPAPKDKHPCKMELDSPPPCGVCACNGCRKVAPSPVVPSEAPSQEEEKDHRYVTYVTDL
ncbi:hypothetical protein TSMEX_005238, partial [Taenia solium]